MLDYCRITAKQTLEKLRTDEKGLSEEEATRRIASYGRNVIERQKNNSLFKLFFSQFKEIMTILLIAAAGVSAVIAFLSGDKSDLTDTFIILFIIFLNAIVGTVQQFRADKAIENLKRLSVSTAKVRRGGKERVIDSADLTVGDVVCLEEGDLVPADCRILSCSSLKCDESALTGESQGVEKNAEAIAESKAGGASADNMLFHSSYVLSGSATAVVTGVGRNTQIGAIADMLDDSEKLKSPLEKSLNKLGKIISVFVIIVAAIIFITGLFVRSKGLLENFMTAVAVAVAAIPEGLPAVVTIIMAMGVQRMSRENVVIRKLRSVETLGGCSCICTDKTGTLTENKMKVTEVYSDFQQRSLGDITGVNSLLFQCAAVCSHVKGVKGAYVGDPTEIALKELADDAEYFYEHTVTGEIPFTSERKMMSVAATSQGGSRLYVKGAPDVLLKHCAKIQTGKGIREITKEDVSAILSRNDRMSDGALRVLAFAYREDGALKEENLIFIGLCGMIDGLKQGVAQAVEECKRAGVTTVMITGDHARTAFAIAKKAGIATDISQVVTGEQLDRMTKPRRAEAIRNGRVFARVSPKHKNIIVKIKQNAGEVVAMTGDGVNDAPPIKSADIGIAMGKSGTDVTKSVADMVIADDNFTTIVSAVREGRRIAANIRKTIQFFISTNLAEVFTVLVAALVFFQYDFLPSTQLLWINLITDSFPVLALGVEKGDHGAMSRPPERAEKALFSSSSIFIILISGAYISGVTLGIYAFALANFGNAVATTMTFLAISFCELFQAFNIRSERGSAFGKGALSNKVLLATVAVGVAVNVLLCVSPLAPAFGIVPLTAGQWIAVFGLSLSVVPFGELYKLFLRKGKKRLPRRAELLTTYRKRSQRKAEKAV